jgi:hypothetical protein
MKTCSAENAISRLNWDMKNYMETKKHFITELGYLDDSSVFGNLFRLSSPRIRFNNIYGNSTWSELYDTLALTKTIFPDFSQLINLRMINR